MSYLSSVLRSAIPAAIFWGILLYSVHKDRSRYRNCAFMGFAVWFSFPLLVNLAGRFSRQVIVLLILFIFLGILLVPIILIANGIIMIKREGHSFKNLLSFCLGIMILAGEICTVLFVLSPFMRITDRSRGIFLAKGLPAAFLLISLTVIYLSLSFLSFMIYTLFLEVIPRKRDFDYIIIHGSGLIGGSKISKLLSDRLDKAIEVYRKDPTPPVMIPSGGKGRDEDLAEADAMAEYLLEHGIPEDHIIRENASATTKENLINSKKIIEEQPGEHYTALVTSNYHVYRALRHCRTIGFACTGIGAPVASYYWPSAMIREYAAIHADKKHLIWLVGIWLILILLPLILFLSV